MIPSPPLARRLLPLSPLHPITHHPRLAARIAAMLREVGSILPPMSQMPSFTSPDVTPLSSDLETAARAFLPDATEIASVPGHPSLARVSAPTGLWRVRRWPETTPNSDVTFSHEVIDRAREAGIATAPALLTPPGAPEDASAIRLDGRLYDAQRWLPGAPPAGAEVAWPSPEDRIDLPVTVAPVVFTTLVTALARLHDATAALATRRGIPTAPLRLLPGTVRQAQGRHLDALRPRARQEPTIQRWLATGERLIAAAEPLIRAATEPREPPSAVLHLGLWPSHVLIDNGHLSGLLGWERVAAGSPLLDLAQAVIRLQGWRDETVEMALGAYGDLRDLKPEERRLLPAVAALDAVATTGRLLEQTFVIAEAARPPAPLRAGIDMMLRSMADIERSLLDPSQKSRRRTWVRRPHTPGAGPRGGTPRERRR